MLKSDKKILIIDDDLRMDKMLVFLFKGHGFKAEFADSGSHALELLKQFKPDVIILDIMMPNMDGFAVCEKIKKDANLKDIPIIVLSHISHIESKERALSLGVCDYIEKPFKSLDLIKRIKAVIN